MSDSEKQLDLAAVRDRLQNAGGRDYWRSLDELAGTPEFQDLLHREFPRQAVGWSEDEDPVEGRRNFLKLMGASLALAGLTGCTRQPTEHIAPYIRQPEELIPGRPMFYATASTLSGVANGVLVESHEGRPTKIEGNPEHPATLGACDPFSQASVLQLYDPDRAQAVTYDGDIRGWGAFFVAFRKALEEQKSKNGAGIRILTETITSPSMGAQFQAIRKTFPGAKWHQWEPTGAHSARAGATQTFGQPVNTYYDFSAADVVVSLDSDFLASGPGSLRYARQFSMRRRVTDDGGTMNRLYVVEAMPTPTGAKADHRLPLRAGDIEEFAWALATGVQAANGPKKGDNEAIYRYAGPIGQDLLRHKGSSVVIAGEFQPPIVHALAHVMNSFLGNVGKTVFYTDSIEANPVDQLASLQDLVKDLDAGSVDLLLILGGNPVFNAPVEMGMRDRIKKAKVRAHLSQYEDETSELCQWNLPETHYLETWGDARAFDGTVSIQQPLIEPLYGGQSIYQILQAMTDSPDTKPYDIVRGYWSSQHTGADFDSWWRSAIYLGVVPGTAFPAKTFAVHGEAISARAQQRKLGGKLEVIFRPDPTIYDGRFANSGWLQELPKPITKLTWDNAAMISKGDAQRLGVENEIAYTTVRYPLTTACDRKALESALTAVPGFHRTDEHLWSWSTPAAPAPAAKGTHTFTSSFGDGSVSLGHVELEAKALKLETNSPQRAQRGRALLDPVIGPFVEQPTIETTTLEEMMASPAADEGRDRSSDLPPDEERAIIHETLDRHYRGLLDEPVPMLGNVSPREAVKTKKGREKLVEWIKYIENLTAREESNPAMASYDMSWMWDELGIAELRR